MPRHLPSKNIQDDDTIILILRSFLSQPLTFELTDGLEYSGILTEIDSDRFGKLIWLTLSHVTMRSSLSQCILIKPLPKPQRERALPPIDITLPQEIQLVQQKYPILRKIPNFDYSRFTPLPAQQQDIIVSQLGDQEQYEYDDYNQYGKYVSETRLQMNKVAKIHCGTLSSASFDFLNRLQSYLNRLQQTQRKENLGKGQATSKEHRDEVLVAKLKGENQHLADEIDKLMNVNPNEEFNIQKKKEKDGGHDKNQRQQYNKPNYGGQQQYNNNSNNNNNHNNHHNNFNSHHHPPGNNQYSNTPTGGNNQYNNNNFPSNTQYQNQQQHQGQYQQHHGHYQQHHGHYQQQQEQYDTNPNNMKRNAASAGILDSNTSGNDQRHNDGYNGPRANNQYHQSLFSSSSSSFNQQGYNNINNSRNNDPNIQISLSMGNSNNNNLNTSSNNYNNNNSGGNNYNNSTNDEYIDYGGDFQHDDEYHWVDGDQDHGEQQQQ